MMVVYSLFSLATSKKRQHKGRRRLVQPRPYSWSSCSNQHNCCFASAFLSRGCLVYGHHHLALDITGDMDHLDPAYLCLYQNFSLSFSIFIWRSRIVSELLFRLSMALAKSTLVLVILPPQQEHLMAHANGFVSWLFCQLNMPISQSSYQFLQMYHGKQHPYRVVSPVLNLQHLIISAQLYHKYWAQKLYFI